MTLTALHRSTGGVLAAALGAALTVSTWGAAPAGAREAVDVRPTHLARSTSTAPHVEGNLFVQGTLRTRVGAGPARYVGLSRDGHVLISGHRVVRVTATGSRHVIARRVGSAFLAPDGETLWTQRWGRRVLVQQHDALTGWDGRKLRVSPRTTLLGGWSTRVVLTDGRRTSVVRWRGDGRTPGRPRTLLRRHVHAVDLAHDRMAYFTRDPYEGGCSVVATVRAPHRRLWRSCTHRVESFSPGGTRMTTVDILSDGIGPNAVTLRTRRGAKLADYTVGRRGWVGQQVWAGPSDSPLTLDVHGPRWSTVAECDDAGCTRIARLTRTEPEA